MVAESEGTVLSGKRYPRFSLPVIVPLIRISDFSLVFLVGFAAYYWYVSPSSIGFDHRYLTSIFLGATTAIVTSEWLGVYKRPEDFVEMKWSGIRRIIVAWTISFSLLLTLAFALKVSSEYSRIWATLWYVITTFFLVGTRMITFHFLSRLSDAGWFTSRVVIVGAGQQGERLARHLTSYRKDLNVEVVGFIDDRKTRIPESLVGHTIIGGTDDLILLIRQNEIDQVFIALPWHAHERLREIINKLAQTPVPIHLSPDLVGFEFPEASYGRLGQIPMLHLFDRPISGVSSYFKHAEDLILGTLLILVLLPFLSMIALAIKLDSSGPIFFKQRRYGFNNQTFFVWKFRTMFAELADPDCEVQTKPDDHRVTRVGRVLRRTSFDELPQLINVLRGEMSLVGPRPHAIATKAEGQLFEDIVEEYAARHRVKPGITGWAQVNNWRGETPRKEDIQKRVEFDLYYIKNWSIWFDLQILLMTLVILFRGQKAY